METDEDTTHSGAHEIDVEVADRRLLSPLESIVGTDARTVYGDPVSVGEKTVIPAASIVYGLGMGGGSGTDEMGDEGGEGFGGGGGVRATPLGVVEVTPDETRFVRFGADRRLAGLFALGIAIGLALGRLGRR
ncbi:spore germination protein GerW family protein [Haloferax sp. YSMS24]|uniref:spore germination protein GerW family protein n=1 Tax=Haloferax sp. YSMS24 TaxID=3388425 RepID=UPI00398CCC18